MTILITYD